MTDNRNRHSGPLLAAEQAIARYGSVQEAANNTPLPLRDLARAMRRLNAQDAPTPAWQPTASSNATPIRHLRISDELWQQVTDRAIKGHLSRTAVIIAALQRELGAP